MPISPCSVAEAASSSDAKCGQAGKPTPAAARVLSGVSALPSLLSQASDAEIPGVDMQLVLRGAPLLESLHLSYPVSIIVAMTADCGIGRQNALPWPPNPVDFRFFSHTTQFTGQHQDGGTTHRRNAVLMGLNTWRSLPPKAKPLRNRINVVVSSTVTLKELQEEAGGEEVFLASSLPGALALLEEKCLDCLHHAFVIGGRGLYASALALGVVSSLFITRISAPFPADVFFPSFGPIEEIHTSSSSSSNGAEAAEGGSKGQEETEETPAAAAVAMRRGDAGLWCSGLDGFETTYISKSRAHRGVSFDFVVMERRPIQQQQQQQHQQQQQQQHQQQQQQQHQQQQQQQQEGGFGRASLSLEVFEALEAARGEYKEGGPQRGPPLKAIPHVRGRLHEEMQYLDLIADILNNGVEQPDRTGVGIVSQFGRMMRFSLNETFPLLTTKRVFWKGVVEELLWFIRGDTNANNLSKVGVKIWDLNATREFLDSRGLTDREPGDIGPVYGFQWRHFGAEYSDMHADYTGQGVDQLKQVIETLRTNPYDRRIIMTAWNPAALHLMALPPCHLLCQFYVANGSLSCMLYQRSCDVGLGVPFNIASYSLLTLMLAQICNLKPGEFVHAMANTHIYSNHVEALKLQIQREPRPFPIVHIKGDPKEIEDFTRDSFELVGYKPHFTIKMEMAV